LTANLGQPLVDEIGGESGENVGAEAAPIRSDGYTIVLSRLR